MNRSGNGSNLMKKNAPCMARKGGLIGGSAGWRESGRQGGRGQSLECAKCVDKFRNLFWTDSVSLHVRF